LLSVDALLTVISDKQLLERRNKIIAFKQQFGNHPVSPTKEVHRPTAQNSQFSYKKFTGELLEKFINSRPEGCSKWTIEFYRYTLTHFVGYALNSDGVNAYLKIAYLP
jgi:hypothetical protein